MGYLVMIIAISGSHSNPDFQGLTGPTSPTSPTSPTGLTKEIPDLTTHRGSIEAYFNFGKSKT
jgi:hypothetical protein